MVGPILFASMNQLDFDLTDVFIEYSLSLGYLILKAMIRLLISLGYFMITKNRIFTNITNITNIIEYSLIFIDLHKIIHHFWIIFAQKPPWPRGFPSDFGEAVDHQLDIHWKTGLRNVIRGRICKYIQKFRYRKYDYPLVNIQKAIESGHL